MESTVGLDLDGSFLDLRRYPRVRVEAPFPCALGRKGFMSWWSQAQPGLGVVFDVSIRGAKLITEVEIKPGERMSMTLNVPRQAVPVEVTTATVRWVVGQTVGVEFLDYSSESEGRLRRFLAQVDPKPVSPQNTSKS